MERHIPRALKVTILAIAVAVLLPACASGKRKAQCPVPDGVKCMGLADVYRNTENADFVAPPDDRKRRRNNAPAQTPAAVQQPAPNTPAASAPRRPVAYQPVTFAGAVQEGETLSVITQTTHASQPNQAVVQQQYAPPTADPVRAAAKVMRILVKAWEDESGSLHMPGTIFTEIEPRRWNVGSPTHHDTGGFRLLEGLGDKAAKESQASASGANAVANRPGS